MKPTTFNDEFRDPSGDARRAAEALHTKNMAGRFAAPVIPRKFEPRPGTVYPKTDPPADIQNPVDIPSARKAERERAGVAGLVNGQDFRTKLGLSYSAFIGAIGSIIPKPLLTRGGNNYWLSEVVDDCCAKLKR